MSGVDRDPTTVEVTAPAESEVTGVTDDSGHGHFTRASHLYECCNCEANGLTEQEIAAVRPRDHAVMLCNECMPDPPEEWL